MTSEKKYYMTITEELIVNGEKKESFEIHRAEISEIVANRFREGAID